MFKVCKLLLMLVSLSVAMVQAVASERNRVQTPSSELVKGAVAPSRPLMRLFTTNEDRLVLDQIKRMAPQDVKQEDGAKGPPEFLRLKETVSNEIQIKGLVIREHAAPVIWINDSSTLEGSNKWQDLEVRFGQNARENLSFELISDTTSARLQPGKTWVREEGLITEHYLVVPSETATVSTEVFLRSSSAPPTAGVSLPDTPAVRAAAESVSGAGMELETIINTLSPNSRISQAEAILRGEQVNPR